MLVTQAPKRTNVFLPGKLTIDPLLLCEFFSACFLQCNRYLVPGARYYYLFSYVFRRRPQLLTLTKNFHYDANKENG